MTTAHQRHPPRIRHDERPLSQRGVKQPTLLDAPDKATLAFLDFHHKNPEVWALFRDICLRLYQRGVTHYGARCVMEVVRYESALRTEGQPWRINNNFIPFYSRLLMMQDARFVGFFELRQSKQRRRFAA